MSRDAKIKGLVLAAGRGSRLGNGGDAVPKCLLEVGRRCLVEHQLDALAEAGVGPTALVVGYSADEVRETVGIRAEYVTNPRWNRTNSLYSFWLAREWLTGPVMILNSDVVFSPEILERLLETEGDAIAIDTSSGGSREQMKVKVADGRFVEMRKDLPQAEVAGENVGILKLTAETVQALIAEADRIVAAGDEKSWLGAAVSRVASLRPIAAVDVSDLPWIEIDFMTDLERARKEVWPRIEGGHAKGRRWRAAGRIAIPLLLATIPIAVYRAFTPSTVEASWEVVAPMGDLPLMRLGELGQSWWPIVADHMTSVRLSGPGPVRVDTRLLDPEADGSAYVIEVALDGERVDFYNFDTSPSGSLTHPDWVVGKRKRVTLDLPEGVHEVGARLVAPADMRCLMRIRSLRPPIED